MVLLVFFAFFCTNPHSPTEVTAYAFWRILAESVLSFPFFFDLFCLKKNIFCVVENRRPFLSLFSLLLVWMAGFLLESPSFLGGLPGF